jgi:hypothetical protein
MKGGGEANFCFLFLKNFGGIVNLLTYNSLFSIFNSSKKHDKEVQE